MCVCGYLLKRVCSWIVNPADEKAADVHTEDFTCSSRVSVAHVSVRHLRWERYKQPDAIVHAWHMHVYEIVCIYLLPGVILIPSCSCKVYPILAVQVINNSVKIRKIIKLYDMPCWKYEEKICIVLATLICKMQMTLHLQFTLTKEKHGNCNRLTCKQNGNIKLQAKLFSSISNGWCNVDNCNCSFSSSEK